VHDRGDAALEGVLRLIEEAARPRPLGEVLAALCAEVSSILSCEIVSIYLREKSETGEALRMAANVGFPAGAISKVRLKIGEGIVGHVAQALRPVSVELAPTDPRFKAFPELGEERFPIFLAVPLLVGRRAEGVMVLQRAAVERGGRRFDLDEVVLATALASSFAYALERARVRRSETAPSKESRRARLEGESLSAGSELGRVETLPTFEGLAALWGAKDASESDAAANDPAQAARRAAQVKDAFESLAKDLGKARKRVAPKLGEPHRTALDALSLLESDSRFLEALADEGSKGNVPLALRKVARDYAQVPYRSGPGTPVQGWLTERSEEVEELCLLVAARATGERVPSGNGALLVPERLSGIVALAAVAHRTSAIAVGNTVPRDSLAAAIVRAAGIPAVGGVGGLFAWARAGDVVLVDADEGVVRVNPSATQIARFRQRERERRRDPTGEEPER
jgi:phosphotransferase system enzyme I (PtsP)